MGILLVFVFGPYYSNFSLENLEDYQDAVYLPSANLPSRSLNFSSQQGYYLLNSTFLDWNSIVIVSFNTTQPIYILVTQDTQIPLFEKSIFENKNGTSKYYIVEPDSYIILAEGFSGTASVRVALLLSIITRTKPYALWGQIMYYGGIGLLGASVVLIVVSWLRKERPLPSKQAPKTADTKRHGKGR
jgi:hypothetical protein